MRKYDTTFILDGSLGVNEREALIERFSNSLTKLGGKIDRIVRWGQRTLAYTINKRAQGYYVIFYHISEPSTIRSFERELTIHESVHRYMTLVFDGMHPSYIPDETVKGIMTAHVEVHTDFKEVTGSHEEPLVELTETFEDETLGGEENAVNTTQELSESSDTSLNQEQNGETTVNNNDELNKEDEKE